MTPDERLLQRYVAERSAEAFGQIVQRYAGMVFGVALRVTADRAAAEDVAQDCFFKLTQKAEQVDQLAAIEARAIQHIERALAAMPIPPADPG